MDYNLDFFVVRKDNYLNEEYALKDYSKGGKKLPKNFYYYYFMYQLLNGFSSVEFLKFLNFQINNSKYGYGFVSFLKENIIKFKINVTSMTIVLGRESFFKNKDRLELFGSDIDDLNFKRKLKAETEPYSLYTEVELRQVLEYDYVITNQRIIEILEFLKGFSPESLIKKSIKELGVEEIIDKDSNNSKLKLKGSPSQLAYLFTELHLKGFLEPKLHNGETSYAGTAKILWDHFDISTTKENWIKEMNPNKNTLGDVKRAKFSIPKASDLQ